MLREQQSQHTRLWKNTEITFKEVRFEINIKDVSTKALDRVIKRQDMHSFSIFDVKALVHIDEVAEFDSEIVASHFIHLYTTLLDVVGAQANEDSVASLLASIVQVIPKTTFEKTL
jgi:hypothetical protein